MQMDTKKDYLQHSIKVAVMTQSPFPAPIITIAENDLHKTYEQMAELGFLPKKRRKDPWTLEEVATMIKAIQDISSGKTRLQVSSKTINL